MTIRFNALVLLSNPLGLDMEQTAQEMFLRHPALGPVEYSGDEMTGTLTVDGATLSVAAVNGVYPESEFRPPLKLTTRTGNTPVSPKHNAYILISYEGEGEGLEWAKAYAALVTLAAATFAQNPGVTGVFWPASYGLWSREQVTEAAEEIMTGQSPIDSWISFAQIAPNNVGRDDVLGVVTFGLKPFLGREIELAPEPISVQKALTSVYGAIWLMLDDGKVFTDGSRVSGPGIGGSYTIRDVEFWLRRGTPAYVLVGPDAVVDAETLLPEGVEAEDISSTDEDGSGSRLGRLFRFR